MRATPILGLCLTLVAASGEARADLKMTPAPLLGPGAVVSDGWVPFAVRLESTEKSPVKATLRVSPTGGQPGQRSEALVTLLPGSSSVVRLPVRLAGAWSVQFQLVAESGKELAGESVRTGGRNAPLLFDMQTPARLPASLQGLRVPVGYSPDGSHGSRAPQIQVSAAWADPASGDLVLPQRAAEWMAVTAVVAPSDALARLGGGDLEALGDFVLAGGTLAVVVKRPEDLRQGVPAGGAGRPPPRGRPGRAPEAILLGRSRGGRGLVVEGRRAGRPAAAAEGGAGGPGKAVSEGLVEYAGGTLRQSDFGASAPYGLGEIHLLAFDPSKAPEVDDPWVKSRLIELTRHAWDRRASWRCRRGGRAGARRRA